MSKPQDDLRELLNESPQGPAFSESLHERTLRALQREQARDVAMGAASPAPRGGHWAATAAAAALLLAMGLWLMSPGTPVADPSHQQVELAPPAGTSPPAAPFIPNPAAADVLNRTVRPVQQFVADLRPTVEVMERDARALTRYLLNQLPVEGEGPRF